MNSEIGLDYEYEEVTDGGVELHEGRVGYSTF